MTIAFSAADSDADFADFGQIIAQYMDWMRTRYRDAQWFIDQVAAAQSLDAELGDLAAKYSPPRGLALIARVDGSLAGAGAWRHHADGVCEMKRVFVRNAFKGLGIGRGLCEGLMRSGRDHGYRRMRLDTAGRMTEAQDLYRKLGFRPCPPYLDYPPQILAELRFLEARLGE
jgi:carbonic anhydrase